MSPRRLQLKRCGATVSRCRSLRPRSTIFSPQPSQITFEGVDSPIFNIPRNGRRDLVITNFFRFHTKGCVSCGLLMLFASIVPFFSLPSLWAQSLGVRGFRLGQFRLQLPKLALVTFLLPRQLRVVVLLHPLERLRLPFELVPLPREFVLGLSLPRRCLLRVVPSDLQLVLQLHGPPLEVHRPLAGSE